MNRASVHPLGPWVAWVLVIPLALMGAGITLVAATEVGDLPFDNPDLWWAGAVVPLAGGALLYGLVRRRRALQRFASEELAPLLALRVNPGRQAIRSGLSVMALLFAFAALLGPRWGIYMDKQKVRGVDVVVALDLSRSMLAEDMQPNRLERAKRDLRQQLTERPIFRQAHRLGLLAFAGTTSLRVPLTTDHLAFRNKLEALQFGSVPRGGTAIARAIRAATDLFAQSPEHATRILLLVTDGEDHEGDAEAAAAEAFKEHNVRVFTVGVGDAARTVGAEVPAGPAGERRAFLFDGQIVFSRVNVEALEKIAEAGGGNYAPLQDLPSLVSSVGGMWKAELTTEERRRHRPRYQWFLAAALGLLVLESVLRDCRLGEVPVLQRTWQAEAPA
ncbi:MAG: VWA domain-containing protein [Planctomycetes bacterium]|nr:VWA domain-containing protein [Planctomycetota bacterium]